jgi:hypothetical protein
MAGVEQAANSTWLQMWGLYKDHPASGKAAFRLDKVSGCAGVCGGALVGVRWCVWGTSSCMLRALLLQALAAAPDAARPVTYLVGSLWPPELPETHVRCNKANL